MGWKDGQEMMLKVDWLSNATHVLKVLCRDQKRAVQGGKVTAKSADHAGVLRDA